MGRLAIQLMIVGALVNAGAHVLPPFWRFAQFEDAVLETARLSSRSAEQDVRLKVVALAERYRIPLTANDFVIKRDGQRTVVGATYELGLEYFPGRTYPWQFVLDVEGLPPRFDAVP